MSSTPSDKVGPGSTEFTVTAVPNPSGGFSLKIDLSGKTAIVTDSTGGTWGAGTDR
jgi:hypothetical protein